jgi:hypothetical protein
LVIAVVETVGTQTLGDPARLVVTAGAPGVVGWLGLLLEVWLAGTLLWLGETAGLLLLGLALLGAGMAVVGTTTLLGTTLLGALWLGFSLLGLGPVGTEEGWLGLSEVLVEWPGTAEEPLPMGQTVVETGTVSVEMMVL